MIEICRGLPDEKYTERVLGLIKSHGWAVEHIDSRNGRRTAITSTFGLCLLGHPEFVVFGCDVLEGFALLEPLALAVESGRQFDALSDLTDVQVGPEQYALIGFPCSAEHLPTVNQLFRPEGAPPIPALLLYRADVFNTPDAPASAGPAQPARCTTYQVSEHEAIRAAASATGAE